MANISKSEIKREANKIINDIFIGLYESIDKTTRNKAFSMIDRKIIILEHGERGLELFAWLKVKQILNSKYGENFIRPKIDGRKLSRSYAIPKGLTPNIVIVDDKI